MDLNVLLVCTMPGGVADFGPIRGREISHHTPQRNDILAGAAQWAVPATTHSDILPEQWSHLLTQTLRWFSHIIQNPFQNRWIILAPPEKLREKKFENFIISHKGVGNFTKQAGTELCQAYPKVLNTFWPPYLAHCALTEIWKIFFCGIIYQNRLKMTQKSCILMIVLPKST